MSENERRTELGDLKIANEVVGIIAGLAATEVPGVAGMSGGIAGGIAEMLGHRNLSKGVKVDVGAHECVVDLFVIIEYGYSIPEVARQIQENVKRAIEVMTGLDVMEVNLHVLGVQFPQEKKEDKGEKVEEEQVPASRGSKMTLLDRVFLGISALVLVIFAGLTAATLFGSDVLVAWLNSPSFGFDGSLVALILVLLAAYLVVLIGRMDTSKYIVYQRELGTVRISADSVESLIVEAASQIPGVQQVRASFTDVVEPKVTLKITAYPDHNLGELSEEIQESVKEYVEKRWE